MRMCGAAPDAAAMPVTQWLIAMCWNAPWPSTKDACNKSRAWPGHRAAHPWVVVASFAASHSPWQQGTVQQDSATSCPPAVVGIANNSGSGRVAETTMTATAVARKHRRRCARAHPLGMNPCNLRKHADAKAQPTILAKAQPKVVKQLEAVGTLPGPLPKMPVISLGPDQGTGPHIPGWWWLHLRQVSATLPKVCGVQSCWWPPCHPGGQLQGRGRGLWQQRREWGRKWAAAVADTVVTLQMILGL